MGTAVYHFSWILEIKKKRFVFFANKIKHKKHFKLIDLPSVQFWLVMLPSCKVKLKLANAKMTKMKWLVQKMQK